MLESAVHSALDGPRPGTVSFVDGCGFLPPDTQVTLLAAVKTDHAIWIGADGRHVGQFGADSWGMADSWAVPVQKLYPFMDRLVWGWYGDAGGSAADQLSGIWRPHPFPTGRT